MVSAAAPGLPQYSITAFVDDIMIGRYSSNTRDIEMFVPVPEILSRHVRRKMEYAFHLEEEEKKGLEKIMEFSNMTYGSADIHVYQKKFICELDDDGSVGGFQEAAFDGEGFATFDKEKGVFVPLTQKASDVIRQCANCDLYAKSDKFYMENYCIHDLKLYLPYLIKLLDKKVPPKVKVSSSESESGTKLHCRVYGFYPRDVEVKWIKNGRDEIHSEEAAQILPNPDGTYQIRVSVGVTPEGGATYSCHIDHSSLNSTLVVPFPASFCSCARSPETASLCSCARSPETASFHSCARSPKAASFCSCARSPELAPSVPVPAPRKLPPSVPVPAPRKLPPSVPVPAPQKLPPSVPVPASRKLPPSVPVPASRKLPPSVPVPAPQKLPPSVPVPAPQKLPPSVPVPAPRKLPPSVPVPAPRKLPSSVPVPVLRKLSASAQGPQQQQLMPVLSDQIQPAPCPAPRTEGPLPCSPSRVLPPITLPEPQ
uniref:LOC100170569 protein n=2 Tax=Xenopus tropicalis TaxID=8364 RepID=B3DLY2_XENTR|nr:LOC100170569 protein [Xenopus tropicalis]